MRRISLVRGGAWRRRTATSSTERVCVSNRGGEDDLPLLQKCLGDPALMEHLGGPMSAEKIVERQQQYERLPTTGQGRVFKIVEVATGESVGSVGYWERESREGLVYETGWLVLPAVQGRGVATSATAQAIERARMEGKHRVPLRVSVGRQCALKRDLPQARLHAYPRGRVRVPEGQRQHPPLQ